MVNRRGGQATEDPNMGLSMLGPSPRTEVARVEPNGPSRKKQTHAKAVRFGELMEIGQGK